MNDRAQDLKNASSKVKILGFLTIVLGVLAMGAPLVTGLALATLIGIFPRPPDRNP